MDEAATQHAVCALRRCAASATAVTDLILASSGLPQLVVLLEQSLHRAQYAVAQDLVWLIMSLGDDDDLGRAALRAAGALPVLVQMLSLHPLGPQVCPWLPSPLSRCVQAAASLAQIVLTLAGPTPNLPGLPQSSDKPHLRLGKKGLAVPACALLAVAASNCNAMAALSPACAPCILQLRSLEDLIPCSSPAARCRGAPG